MWGSGFLKGMVVTMRNMLRGPITLQYPEERRELPERARWAVRHKCDESGAPKCTACLICVGDCPDGIIRIEQHKTEDGGKHIDAYRYEVGACMICGLCVEACPFDAITLGNEFELSEYSRDDLIYTKDMLLADPIKRVPVQDADLYDTPIPALQADRDSVTIATRSSANGRRDPPTPPQSVRA